MVSKFLCEVSAEVVDRPLENRAEVLKVYVGVEGVSVGVCEYVVAVSVKISPSISPSQSSSVSSSQSSSASRLLLVGKHRFSCQTPFLTLYCNWQALTCEVRLKSVCLGRKPRRVNFVSSLTCSDWSSRRDGEKTMMNQLTSGQ